MSQTEQSISCGYEQDNNYYRYNRQTYKKTYKKNQRMHNQNYYRTPGYHRRNQDRSRCYRNRCKTPSNENQNWSNLHGKNQHRKYWNSSDKFSSFNYEELVPSPQYQANHSPRRHMVKNPRKKINKRQWSQGEKDPSNNSSISFIEGDFVLGAANSSSRGIKRIDKTKYKEKKKDQVTNNNDSEKHPSMSSKESDLPFTFDFDSSDTTHITNIVSDYTCRRNLVFPESKNEKCSGKQYNATFLSQQKKKNPFNVNNDLISKELEICSASIKECSLSRSVSDKDIKDSTSVKSENIIQPLKDESTNEKPKLSVSFGQKPSTSSSPDVDNKIFNHSETNSDVLLNLATEKQTSDFRTLSQKGISYLEDPSSCISEQVKETSSFIASQMKASFSLLEAPSNQVKVPPGHLETPNQREVPSNQLEIPCNQPDSPPNQTDASHFQPDSSPNQPDASPSQPDLFPNQPEGHSTQLGNSFSLPSTQPEEFFTFPCGQETTNHSPPVKKDNIEMLMDFVSQTSSLPATNPAEGTYRPVLYPEKENAVTNTQSEKKNNDKDQSLETETRKQVKTEKIPFSDDLFSLTLNQGDSHDHNAVDELKNVLSCNAEATLNELSGLSLSNLPVCDIFGSRNAFFFQPTTSSCPPLTLSSQSQFLKDSVSDGYENCNDSYFIPSRQSNASPSFSPNSDMLNKTAVFKRKSVDNPITGPCSNDSPVDVSRATGEGKDTGINAEFHRCFEKLSSRPVPNRQDVNANTPHSSMVRKGPFSSTQYTLRTAKLPLPQISPLSCWETMENVTSTLQPSPTIEEGPFSSNQYTPQLKKLPLSQISPVSYDQPGNEAKSGAYYTHKVDHPSKSLAVEKPQSLVNYTHNESDPDSLKQSFSLSAQCSHPKAISESVKMHDSNTLNPIQSSSNNTGLWVLNFLNMLGISPKVNTDGLVVCEKPPVDQHSDKPRNILDQCPSAAFNQTESEKDTRVSQAGAKLRAEPTNQSFEANVQVILKQIEKLFRKKRENCIKNSISSNLVVKFQDVIEGNVVQYRFPLLKTQCQTSTSNNISVLIQISSESNSDQSSKKLANPSLKSCHGTESNPEVEETEVLESEGKVLEDEAFIKPANTLISVSGQVMTENWWEVFIDDNIRRSVDAYQFDTNKLITKKPKDKKAKKVKRLKNDAVKCARFEENENVNYEAGEINGPSSKIAKKSKKLGSKTSQVGKQQKARTDPENAEIVSLVKEKAIYSKSSDEQLPSASGDSLLSLSLLEELKILGSDIVTLTSACEILETPTLSQISKKAKIVKKKLNSLYKDVKLKAGSPKEGPLTTDTLLNEVNSLRSSLAAFRSSCEVLEPVAKLPEIFKATKAIKQQLRSLKEDIKRKAKLEVSVIGGENSLAKKRRSYSREEDASGCEEISSLKPKRFELSDSPAKSRQTHSPRVTLEEPKSTKKKSNNRTLIEIKRTTCAMQTHLSEFYEKKKKLPSPPCSFKKAHTRKKKKLFNYDKFDCLGN